MRIVRDEDIKKESLTLPKRQLDFSGLGLDEKIEEMKESRQEVLDEMRTAFELAGVPEERIKLVLEEVDRRLVIIEKTITPNDSEFMAPNPFKGLLTIIEQRAEITRVLSELEHDYPPLQ